MSGLNIGTKEKKRPVDVPRKCSKCGKSFYSTLGTGMPTMCPHCGHRQ